MSMGCGAAKAVQTQDQKHGSAKEVPKPVAFEIPVTDEQAPDQSEGTNGDSIVKKHPPKRLQRLEEQVHSVLTAEEIEDKHKKAEERRLEIIEERINKARQAQQKNMDKSTNADEEVAES